MKQFTRSLLALGGLAVIGGTVALVAWWRAGDVVVATGDTATGKRKLFDIATTDVTQLSLSFEGGRGRMVRHPEGWRIEEPLVTAADEREVGRTVGMITSAVAEVEFGTQEHPDTPNDAAAGLDAPTTSIVFDAGGRRYAVDIGATSPFNGTSYARITYPDGTIVTSTISASTAQTAARGWNDYRDMRVLGADHSRVRQLTVTPRVATESAIAFRIERDMDPMLAKHALSERRYRVIEPALGRADTMVVEAVLVGLARAPLSALLSQDHGGDLAPHGLADPAWTVRVTLAPLFPDATGAEAPPIERTISISDVVDGAVRVTRADERFVGTAAAVLVDALAQTPTRLESKRFFEFTRDAVGRVEIETAELGSVVIERHTTETGDVRWRMLAPEPARAKAHLVAGIILVFADAVGKERKASGARAKDPSVLQGFGLDKNVRRIRFLDRLGDPLGTLLLGGVDGPHVYAMAEGGEFIATVPKEVLDQLPASVAELIDTR